LSSAAILARIIVVLPVEFLLLFGHVGRGFFEHRKLAKGTCWDKGVYLAGEDMEANLKLGFARA
jgi:hypothetical protein